MGYHQPCSQREVHGLTDRLARVCVCARGGDGAQVDAHARSWLSLRRPALPLSIPAREGRLEVAVSCVGPLEEVGGWSRHGHITLTTTDEHVPCLKLPVRLETRLPRLTMAPRELVVAMDGTWDAEVQDDVVLTNDGEAPLVVTELHTALGWVSAAPGLRLPLQLPPGKSARLALVLRRPGVYVDGGGELGEIGPGSGSSGAEGEEEGAPTPGAGRATGELRAALSALDPTDRGTVSLAEMVGVLARHTGVPETDARLVGMMELAAAPFVSSEGHARYEQLLGWALGAGRTKPAALWGALAALDPARRGTVRAEELRALLAQHVDDAEALRAAEEVMELATQPLVSEDEEHGGVRYAQFLRWAAGGAGSWGAAPGGGAQGLLRVRSNDPSQATALLPLRLAVGAPKLRLDPPTLSVVLPAAVAYVEETVFLQNDGDLPAKLSSVMADTAVRPFLR